MILMPKMGKLVSSSGSKAQCIAQANEVATPKASQLILKFIKLGKDNNCNFVAERFKKYFYIPGRFGANFAL